MSAMEQAGERCGALWPDDPHLPCVLPRRHSNDNNPMNLHRNEEAGWWSNAQAWERAEEIVKEVMGR